MKEITIGLINNTEGSAKLVNGDTIIVAAVVGPKENVRDNLDCDVEVRWSIDSDARDSSQGEHRLILKKIVESLIIRNKYPQTTITVSITVFRDGGSVLSTACNAAVMALIDSGVAMSGLAGTTECAVIENNLVFNPSKEEESKAVCNMFLSWCNTTQTTIASKMSGVTTREQYMEILDKSIVPAKEILAYLRLSYETKCTKMLTI
jgi:exosome complex component RRP46